jgi:peptide/nickel transport system permease protein
LVNFARLGQVPAILLMLAFIAKRLLYGLVVVFGVTVAVFFIFHVLPGNPEDSLGDRPNREEERERLRVAYHLDQPLPVQLALYLNDLSLLSVHDNTPANAQKYAYQPVFGWGSKVLVFKAPYLGRSFRTNVDVRQTIANDLLGTFCLAVSAMILATLLGVSWGLLAALNQGRFWDHTALTLSVVGISAPAFITAIFIQVLLGYYLGEWTRLPLQGSLFERDISGVLQVHPERLVLPALTLAIRPLAIVTQITRNSMIDVLAQDFIRTARAKGSPRRSIILRHALKNAINPVLTTITGWLASLMAGAFFVEYVFSYHGLGYDTIVAVRAQDFPFVMGATITVAVFFVAINLVVDVLYAWIDPRVQLQ